MFTAFKYSICYLFVFLIFSEYLVSQSNISLEAEYTIKSAVIKNYCISLLLTKKTRILKDTFPDTQRVLSTSTVKNYADIVYPGFGYLYNEWNLEIVPLNIKYPDKEWKLYKVKFLVTPSNDTLVNWSSYKYYDSLTKRYTLSTGDIFSLVSQKNILVAVNKNNEVKFIAGPGFNHSIAKDFKLKEKNPDTYIPFLKLKLYTQQHEKIRFLRKEGNFIYFLIINRSPDGITAEFEYKLDSRTPDKMFPIKPLTPLSNLITQLDKTKVDTSSKPNYKLDLNFTSLEDKKHYILDALMKNIYMHRLLHLDNLAERLNIDTTTWHFKEGHSDLDSLLPNYDEYLAEFKLLQYGCCFTEKGPWNCPGLNDKERIEYPIFEPVQLANKYRLVVGSTRMYGNVEFYKFYKNRTEMLVKRPSKYTEQEGGPEASWCKVGNSYGLGNNETNWYRYDFYYHPEYKTQIQKVDGASLPCEYYPPVPLAPPNIMWLFNDICPPFEPRSPYDLINQPVDYYLVALDTKTREVYFLSGKDIYLSKATALYRPGESPQEPGDMSKWELPEKLVYIRDRLYRYRVDKVKEENIIARDDEKMVLEVNGEEYGKSIKLRVTFYNATPEMLGVEVIKE